MTLAVGMGVKHVSSTWCQMSERPPGEEHDNTQQGSVLQWLDAGLSMNHNPILLMKPGDVS